MIVLPVPRRVQKTGLAVLIFVALAAPIGARAADLDPYLPADTESYVSVNVKQVLASPLVKKYGLESARDAIGQLELNGLFEEIGFDPFKHLDRIQLASPTSTDKDRGLAILTGTFDAAKIKKKADASARNNEESVKVHKVKVGTGTHDVYEVVIPGQELAMFMAVVDNKTLLTSPGKDYVVSALRQARLKKKPALANKGFQAVLEKLDPKQGIAVAMLGKSIGKSELLDSLPAGFRNALRGIEVIGGGLSFGNEIKLDLIVSTKANRDAQNLREVLTKGVRLAQVGLAFLGNERKEFNLLNDVLNTVKVGGKGKVVAVSARLTADVLEDFKKDNDD